MREAHEDRCKERGEHTQLYRNELMLAAAQWILWCGQSLFKQILFPGEVDPDQLKNSLRAGTSYWGKGGMSVERWRFWKDGFKAVAIGAGDQKGGYGEESKEVAARAASIMETLEKAMPF